MRCLGLVGLLIQAVGAFGQSVPPLINYQGRLANVDGSPFATGEYSLSVRIWSAATNGTTVWGPQIFDGSTGPGRGPRIPVIQGHFNLVLGPMDTNGSSILAAFDDANRFVEVRVADRPAILPRQQILSTPYALRVHAVGADTLLDESVTQSKLASRPVSTNVSVGGVAISGSSELFSVGVGPNYVAVSNLSVTIATSGRPVFIGLIPDGSTNASFVGSSSIGNRRLEALFQLTRNGEPFATFDTLSSREAIGYGYFFPASAIHSVDPASAGTLVYQLRVRAIDGAAVARHVRLIAYEL